MAEKYSSTTILTLGSSSAPAEDGGMEWISATDVPVRELFFIHAPAGSSHIPRSAEGCTLFLFYPEG